MRLNEKLRCRMYGVDTPPFRLPSFPPYPPPPGAALFGIGVRSWACVRWIQQQQGKRKTPLNCGAWGLGDSLAWQAF